MVVDANTLSCMFALLFFKDLCRYGSALLRFSQYQEESPMNVPSHVEFFKFDVSVFDKNMENVMCPVNDNCDNSKAAENMLGKPSIGCRSHRFNVAVLDILQNYSDIIDTVHGLILKLQNLDRAAKLCSFTKLRLILKNCT